MPRTLFDKLWDAHVVRPETASTPAVLYIDLHLVHEVTSPQAFAQLEQNCRDFDVPLLALGDERQGIVHVIGPELGLTQPGMTVVCGDSHTSTHGAFGALAFGIGTSQVAH